MAVGVKLRGVNGFAYAGAVKIGALMDCTIKETMGTTDASDHDSGGWGFKMTTTLDWTAQIKSWYLDGDSDQIALRAAIPAGTKINFRFYPNGLGTGKSQFIGDGYINDLTLGFPQTAAMPHDISIVGAGALTESTQP